MDVFLVVLTGTYWDSVSNVFKNFNALCFIIFINTGSHFYARAHNSYE